MAQFHPEIIARKNDNPVHADGSALDHTEFSDSDTVDNGPANTSNGVDSDMPTGFADFSASDYVQHTRARHKIPVKLQLIRLSDNLAAIEPPETICSNCHRALVHYIVTKCGKVFDVNRIISGWCRLVVTT